MKKYFILFCFSFLSITFAKGQNSYRDTDGTRTYDSYQVTKNCVAYPVSLATPEKIDSDVFIVIGRNQNVKLNQILMNGDVVIEYSIDASEDEYQNFKTLVKVNADSIIHFLVKRIDFETKFIKLYSTSLIYPMSWWPFSKGTKWFNGTTLNIGILVIPFKLRPKSAIRDFDFNSGLSLGTTLGIRHRISRTEPFYLNLIGYTGLSSVQLNTENTISIKDISGNRNEASFTYAFGIIYELSNVQVGVIMGRDLIANQSQVQWMDFNKNWISIGLGTYLFTRNK
jgi:hypothetical protein